MGRYTDKTEITRGEYVTLAGLLALAKRHSYELTIIEREIATIIGEQPGEGHAGDAVYSDYSVDHLLFVSSLRVAGGAPTQEGEWPR